MGRIIKFIAIVLAILVIGLAAYFLAGFSNSDVSIRYQAVISNPASGEMEVRMMFYSAGKPYIHLFLRDPMLEGELRISGLRAVRGEKALPMWQTIPGVADVQTLWTGFSKEPVEISYTINADWVKGRVLRSHIGEDFGFIRAMNVFYSPVTLKQLMAMIQRNNVIDKNSGTATVAFSIPPGWAFNTPWDEDQSMPIAELMNVYFGVGRMDIIQLQGDLPVSLAVHHSLGDKENMILAESVPVIIRKIADMTGFLPLYTAPRRIITVCPHEMIFGGASGNSSLVVENDLYILSHEIFHWWNGETINTEWDANWIKEGFTEYYQTKVLYSAGLITEDDFRTFMSKTRNQVGQWDSSGIFDFRGPSRRLVTGKGDQRDSDIVYFGGACMAWVLDKELHDLGLSLDEIWLLLKNYGKPVSSDAFIRILSDFAGTELGEYCHEMVDGKRSVFP